MAPPGREPCAPRPRAAAVGRPAADPACAGCAQLGTLRALRRAGLAVQGGLGCEPATAGEIVPVPGRWAAVTGAARLLARGAGALRAETEGARLLVIADRLPADRAGPIERALARAGARVWRIDPADLAGAERAAARAAETDGAALVALAPCTRGEPRGLPLAVDPARCNRCGACLGLACPAVSDPGGEAMAIDAATCSGCGLCAALCRGRAIGAREPAAAATG